MNTSCIALCFAWTVFTAAAESSATVAHASHRTRSEGLAPHGHLRPAKLGALRLSVEDSRVSAESRWKSSPSTTSLPLMVITLTVLNVALLMIGGYRAFNVIRGRTTSNVGMCGLSTPFQYCLFFGQGMLALLAPFMQYEAGDLEYSPLLCVVMVYLLKSWGALLMFFMNEGGLGKMANLFVGHPGTVAKLLGPATCFAIFDVISFIALMEMNPLTYQVLLGLRVIGMVPVWQWVMQRRLTLLQWISIAILTTGILMTKLPAVADNNNSSTYSSLALMSLSAVVSVIGSVYSEKFLKQAPLPTDFQNFVMYTEAGWIVFIASCVQLGTGILSPTIWLQLTQVWVFLAIAVMAALGVCTAYFLKEFNNIMKEICRGFVTVISGIIMWTYYQSFAFSMAVLCEGQGMLLAALSLVLFSIEPLGDAQKKTQEPAEEQKAEKTP